jgi:hypothetical protein
LIVGKLEVAEQYGVHAQVAHTCIGVAKVFFVRRGIFSLAEFASICRSKKKVHHADSEKQEIVKERHFINNQSILSLTNLLSKQHNDDHKQHSKETNVKYELQMTRAQLQSPCQTKLAGAAEIHSPGSQLG